MQTFRIEKGYDEEEIEADGFREEGTYTVFFRWKPNAVAQDRQEVQVLAIPTQFITAIREKTKPS